MRAFLVALMAIAAIAAAPAGDASPAGDLGKIQGTWTTQAGAERKIQVTLTIDGRKAVVRLALPGGGTFQARGEVKIDEKATPKAWDWVRFNGLDGQPFPEIPAIYRLEGDVLTVCNGGPANDRPTAFQAGDGSLADVHRFQRAGGPPADPAR